MGAAARLGADRSDGAGLEVPASDDFRAAIEAGLGWGLLPQEQATEGLDAGRLVRLGRSASRVDLYWQRWRIDSPLMDQLTRTVQHTAARILKAPSR